MRILVLLALAITVTSCSDCDHGREILQLREENEYLRGSRYVNCFRDTSPQYVPAVPTCVEDKQLAGCAAFRDNLQMAGVTLTKTQWDFCDKYEAK